MFSLDAGIENNLLYQNTIYSYKRQKIIKLYLVMSSLTFEKMSNTWQAATTQATS